MTSNCVFSRIILMTAAIMFLSSWYSWAHEDPPHKMIELTYFKCEDSKNLEGGIYGKGPFKRFGPKKSLCSPKKWERISHEEFKILATKWYGIKWENEIPWWSRELSEISSQQSDLDKLSEEGCKQQRGVWGRFGEWEEQRCNLKTNDVGRICEDGKDCQGDCIANITEEQKVRLQQGKILKIKGNCSEFEFNFGCHAFVEKGQAQGILCVD